MSASGIRILPFFRYRLNLTPELGALNRKLKVVTQDFEVACRLIIGTDRIATVMTRMAKLCAAHRPIKLVPTPFAIPKVIHCLQGHRYQDLDPGHIWIQEILKSAAGKLS